MKTIITVLALSLSLLSQGQIKNLFDPSDLTSGGKWWDTRATWWVISDPNSPFRAKLNNLIDARIGQTGTGGVDVTALMNEILALRTRVDNLEKDSTEIHITGFSGAGTSDEPLKIDIRQLPFKGNYTTEERDKLNFPVGSVIFNITTGTFQGRTKTVWKAL